MGNLLPRGGRRRALSIVAAACAAIGVTTVAVADDIANDIDVSVDTVAEVMALNVGGPDGTTQLRLVNRNGDGKNGCNLQSDESVTVGLASDAPAVATVSPDEVTFDDCADTFTITVTPHATGTAHIRASELARDVDAGTFEYRTADFDVTVAGPSNTAPAISVTNVASGVSYTKGSVPVAGCSVTDAEDGNATFPATLSAITGPHAADGIGTQTASCSYTDAGDLHVQEAKTYSIVDATAPSIDYTLDPATPASGWHTTQPVTLTWTVTEPDSTLTTTGCEDQTLTASQLEQTYTCSATSAGGSAGPVSVSVKIDLDGPTVTGAPTTGPNPAGWYKGDVAIDWFCDDLFSGVAFCPDNSTIDGEGRGLTATVQHVADNAGNTTDATSSPAVDIDRGAPIVTGSIADTVYDVAGTPWYKDTATATFAAEDPALADGSAGSGVVSGPTPDSHAFGEGTGQSQSSGATDAAGNTGTGSVTGVNVDARAPEVSSAITSTKAYGDWYKDEVGISVTASDPAVSSGLQTDPSGPQTFTASGSYTAMAVDNVGHSTSAAVLDFLVDADGPSFGACPGAVVIGDSVSITAGDAESGLDVAGSTLTATPSAVGVQGVAFTAKDNVGHESTVTCQIAVIYRFDGFLQPINDTAHQVGVAQSKFKLGSTVPVKFQLKNSAGTVIGPGAVTPVFDKKRIGGTCDVTDDYEMGATTAPTAGATFRWDGIAMQYVYNFSTKGLTAGEWRVYAYLGDGSVAKQVDLCLTK